MIDFENEELVPLARATEWLPRRRRGKKPHASTLYRWATAGCKGVVLETLQVGGTKCTSRQAVWRFIDRLTRGDQETGKRHTEETTSLKPGHVERELDRAGLTT